MSDLTANPGPPYDSNQLVLAHPAWRHYLGKLHHLLTFMSSACGICRTPADWIIEKNGSCVRLSLVQVADPATGLLRGLLCYRCRSRYSDLARDPEPHLKDAHRVFFTDPPAQRCPETVGCQPMDRLPRPLKRWNGPLEPPTHSWGPYGSVIHALALYQGLLCAIDGDPLRFNTDRAGVHVDHDHTTGLIRAVICRRCNTNLGQWRDDTWWAELADAKNAYLLDPPGQRCPDTKGLTMQQRHRPAPVRVSHGDGFVYLGSMPWIPLDEAPDLAEEQAS